jgi:hypothetical protein
LLSHWTSAPAVADWQRFGTARFRWYHLLALSQGIVAVMTGFDVVIPFALAIGCPPALTPLLGMLALAGGMAPLVLPNLLKRADGNLRWLTIVLSAVGETRAYAGLYGASTGLRMLAHRVAEPRAEGGPATAAEPLPAAAPPG